MEFPVDGKRPGFAKFPEWAVEQGIRELLDDEPPTEVVIEISEGALRFEGALVRSNVEVGYFRDPQSKRVVYLTELELVALAKLLTDTIAFGADIRHQIAEASKNISSNAWSAVHALEKYGVTFDDVSEIVDRKISNARNAVKARFDNLGMTTWKS
jgi:hypothetical protein